MTDYTTSDLYDQHGEALQVLEPLLRSYGGRPRFAGEIVTIQCFEDNSRVKEHAAQHGLGKVLVVDGGGSTRCALLGDSIAGDAAKNQWEGIIVYGAVRDVEALAQLDLGICALAPTPRKSVRRGVGQAGLTISFGGVSFVPGSFVYADRDGIVVATEDLARAQQR